MRVFLVTGTSGSGKSTVARGLRAAGRYAVSTDGDDRLCGWTDRAGTPVLLPDQARAEWLDAHDWNWDPVRLDEIIADARAAGAEVAWLCGNSGNQHRLLDRFDRVFLLVIDEATMLRRLDDPTRGNDYGRHGDARAVLVRDLATYDADWRARGAIPVDATGDRAAVVAALVRAADAADAT